MSPHQSHRSRRGAKGEAGAESLPPADSEAPMQRFTSLARALLNVSNKQLRMEQHRYEKAKSGLRGRSEKK